MRDILVTLLVFGSLPLILKKPFFGIIVWTWLGLMNPHRVCWGFATHFPFAQIVAITLFVSLALSYRATSRSFDVRPLVVLAAVWWFWMFVTTIFAMFPELAWPQWDKVWKIMLLTFVTIAMLNTRQRVDALVWTSVVSLGFYGIKGGLFTLQTGGGSAVYGPAGTFIGGNNEIGLALIMTVPLMRYLQLQSSTKWVRNGMVVAMLLTFVSIVATHSRGAFLGLAVMVVYLVMKSRKKAAFFGLLLLALPLVFLMMPEEYFARMETIETYQQDSSAMGRINAWWTAYYVAIDNPFTGGGFNVFNRWTFARYAPNPEDLHDAHSIYFEVLGEHGFVGLALFLGIGIGSLRSLKKVQKYASRHVELLWMRDLSSMVYVSLIGYAISGAFLGLAYFDFYYLLVAISIALSAMVHRYERDGIPVPQEAAAPPAAVPDVPPGSVHRKPRMIDRVVQWYEDL